MPPSSPFLAGICSSVVAFVALTYRDVHNKSFHVRADVPAHAENFTPLLSFFVVVATKTYGGAANHHYSGGILSPPPPRRRRVAFHVTTLTPARREEQPRPTSPLDFPGSPSARL